MSKPISSASFTMATVSSMIRRGVTEASRWVMRLNRPSFIRLSFALLSYHTKTGNDRSRKHIPTAHDHRLAGHIGVLLTEQHGDPSRDLARLGIPLEWRV